MSNTAWLVLIACVACIWGYALFRPRRKEVKEDGPITVLVDEDKVEEFRSSLSTKGLSEEKVNIIPVDRLTAEKVREEAMSGAKLSAIKTLRDSIPSVGLKEAKDYVDTLEDSIERK